MQIVQAPTTQQILSDSGLILRVKTLEIGVWNMDADGTKDVAHGLTYTDIIGVNGKIFQDPGGTEFPIVQGLVTGASLDLFVSYWNSTNIHLSRAAAGTFDNATFDDAVMNRGYLYVFYMM